MFVDIIINCSSYTVIDCRHMIYTHVMIDIWLYCVRHLIVHLTIALTGLATIHLCLTCYFNLILYISFITCSHVICTCTFQFILTHSLGILTLWICIFRSVANYCWSGIGEDRRHLDEHWVLFIRLLVFSLSFIPVISFDSKYIGLTVYSILFFICYHVWLFICHIAVLSCHYSDYIVCSGYFRLSVYAWGIFLAYIRRDFDSTYFGKWGVTLRYDRML